MKVGVMQPYLFPYVGYFQLINHVDRWVVFDDAQFISKGWINRNRILHPEVNKEWQYITVPLKKHSRKSRIMDVEVNDDVRWKEELLGKLTFYKKKAPFYSETRNFIENCLNQSGSALSDWVVSTLNDTCDYLDIPFDCSIFSEMQLNTDGVEHAGQWALEIADRLGADEYVNPHGGYEIFHEDEFSGRDIKLRFLKSKLTPYIQRRGGFVPGLSIVDVMMWNDKDNIREMLNDYEIKSYSELMAG